MNNDSGVNVGPYICDLHYRGPQARGSIKSVVTEPGCMTDLVYHGVHDHRYVSLVLDKETKPIATK